MKAYIQQLLEQTVDQLKANQVLPQDVTPRIQVDRTRDKAHGDLATNLAMMLAKPAKSNPRQLAQQIIDNLPASPLVSKVDIAGPGFINFFLNTGWLADQVSLALADPRLGIASSAQPQTIVVDYSAPNLAKEMHVGHLRSTIIGDATSRVLEFLGHRIIRQNHIGDWGTQFGMLLAYMEEKRKQGAEISMEIADLEEFYRAAKQRFDESAEFAEHARQLVVELQGGNEYCNALWREFIELSLAHSEEIYDRLNVRLTRADVYGESAYNDDLPNVIADLDKAGLLTESDGAQCVFLDEFKGKNDEPLPVIVQKKDGGYLYATTDLAAMRYRNGSLLADRVLYFVDARQSLHFQQVFAVARQAGFVKPELSLEHMAFGKVLGEDGKPYKTRTGGIVKLADLLTESENRAYSLVKTKNPEMSEDELRHIGHVVGIASVKYADLSKHRTSDYVFSFNQMLSFEGNTAPYLLYAYTRVASIFKKAGLEDGNLHGDVVLGEEIEKELATKLLQFGEIVHSVADKGLPHLLCTYLFELSGLFSSFYEQCPVLSAADEATRQSRLKLALLTAKTLKQGLALLGIDTLERM